MKIKTVNYEDEDGATVSIWSPIKTHLWLHRLVVGNITHVQNTAGRDSWCHFLLNVQNAFWMLLEMICVILQPLPVLVAEVRSITLDGAQLFPIAAESLGGKLVLKHKEKGLLETVYSTWINSLKSWNDSSSLALLNSWWALFYFQV